MVEKSVDAKRRVVVEKLSFSLQKREMYFHCLLLPSTTDSRDRSALITTATGDIIQYHKETEVFETLPRKVFRVHVKTATTGSSSTSSDSGSGLNWEDFQTLFQRQLQASGKLASEDLEEGSFVWEKVS